MAGFAGVLLDNRQRAVEIVLPTLQRVQAAAQLRHFHGRQSRLAAVGVLARGRRHVRIGRQAHGQQPLDLGTGIFGRGIGG